MVTIVYIDVLIFINIVVNYFLLMITAFFTGVSKRRGRTALAAIAGSLFSLVIFLPKLNILLSLLIKAAGAILMAMIAYGVKKSARHLFRNAAYLFVASSLVAGAVIAVEELANNSAFVGNNMGIYIDISPLTLIIIVLSVYVILCLFELLFKKHRHINKTYRSKIRMGKRECIFEAMIDSGNKLYDTLTGRDAVILRRSYAPKLLNQRQNAALQESIAGNNAAQYLTEIGEFALLPFTSVGGAGLLLGFGAQSCEVEVQTGKTATIDRPFVAFADDAMLGDTEGIIGCNAVEV